MRILIQHAQVVSDGVTVWQWNKGAREIVVNNLPPDSEVDLMTARNSGLPCISVLWGFRERSFLESYGATMYAKTPQELIDSF